MFDKVLFHIDLDAFFAAVEQGLDPSLRGHPVIVKGPGEHRTVVASASYEARPYGIKAGMPVFQAKRLCPHARFVIGKAKCYADFSERVFTLCRQFTPLVEPASIDEGYLDMTGTERIHGRKGWSTVSNPWPMSAAEQLKKSIKTQTGLNCSIGIGINKLIAKIASKVAKPNGIACILPGYERTFLAPLPVDSLPGIGTKSRQCLQTLAVHTVGDLQRIPINLLKGIFGVVGEDFYYLAAGVSGDTIQKGELPKSISRGTTFDKDTRQVDDVKTTMRTLVDNMCRQTRTLALQGRLVTVRIRYSDFTNVSRCGPLENVTHLDHEIFPLACRLFDQLYNHRLPIRYVAVELGQLTSQCHRQLDLWDPQRFENDRRIYQAVDQIRSRYGLHAIRFAG